MARECGRVHNACRNGLVADASSTLSAQPTGTTLMPSHKRFRHHLGAMWLSTTLLCIALTLAAVSAPVGALNHGGHMVVNQDARGCPPTFVSAPLATAIVGEPFSLEVAACETATATPHIRALHLPSGLSLHNNLNGTTSITGTPQSNDVGRNTVTMSASVGRAVVAGQSLVITVEDPSESASSRNVTTPALGAATTGNSALFGLSVPELLGDAPAQVTAAITTMASIGLRWVRVDADWDAIQPTSASFDWAATDEVVKAAAASGMSVDLVIDDSPTWASSSGSGGTYTQPTSASAFATFAAAVATHYGPRGVHAYEIWNEPNWQQFWLPFPNPSFYTSMLKDSYAAIKAVQPDSTVISGGLAPASTDGTNYNAIEFLTDMYADGAAGSFDALGYHAYSYPALADTDEPWSAWSQMDQTSPSIRSVMAANGDGGKQIWITEVGAPSAGTEGVGTAAQAQEITQVVQTAKSTPWIGEVFMYTYQDSAVDPDYFGLLNADGTQKPAWGALVAALG
jgi:polysaccharide biosynthesis protein PslG